SRGKAVRAGPPRSEGGRRQHERPRRSDPGRQRAAPGQDPGRLDHPQHRANARARGSAGAVRRDLRPAARQRGRLRRRAHAFRGAAPGPRTLHSHAWPGGKSRARERVGRQGRPLSLAGQAAHGAGFDHEPGGPSAWWRRGQDGPRRQPQDAVGQARARPAHAQAEEGVRQADYSAKGEAIGAKLATVWEGGPRGEEKGQVSRSLKKGPFIDQNLAQKIVRLNATRDKRVVRTWARASTIYPEMVG